MDEKLTLKEIVSFVLGFAGVILLCCESEDMAMQSVAWGTGILLMFLCALPWLRKVEEDEEWPE